MAGQVIVDFNASLPCKKPAIAALTSTRPLLLDTAARVGKSILIVGLLFVGPCWMMAGLRMSATNGA